MTKCKDCKNWERAHIGSFTGECTSEKLVYHTEPDRDGVVLSDAQTGYGAIHFGEDFGCIHGEVK